MIYIKQKVLYELKIPGVQVVNNFRNVDGNITLQEIEKINRNNVYILYRGMSIRNFKKPLIEIQKELHQKEPKSHLKINLLTKSQILIKQLEDSEINFINIGNSSCHQASTLQGFVHVIFPIAIRNVNKIREKYGLKKVENLDELKNDNEYNNLIIDVLKEVNFLQENGEKNGNKRCNALKLFKAKPRLGGNCQGVFNTIDCNEITRDLIKNSKILEPNNSNNKYIKKSLQDYEIANIQGSYKYKNIYDRITYSSKNYRGLIEIINLDKITIISEVMKIIIEGNILPQANLVLKFSENDLKDSNLNIYKLLKSCPQLKKDDNSQKKIIEISDIVYFVVDRLSTGKTIKKQINIDEKIYFDKKNKKFSQFPINNKNKKNILYDLKFIIFHCYSGENSGHYIAYSKINNDWYIFNDLSTDYAEKEKPPLKNNQKGNIYPVIFYYVKNPDQIINEEPETNLEYYENYNPQTFEVVPTTPYNYQYQENYIQNNIITTPFNQFSQYQRNPYQNIYQNSYNEPIIGYQNNWYTYPLEANNNYNYSDYNNMNQINTTINQPIFDNMNNYSLKGINIWKNEEIQDFGNTQIHMSQQTIQFESKINNEEQNTENEGKQSSQYSQISRKTTKVFKDGKITNIEYTEDIQGDLNVLGNSGIFYDNTNILGNGNNTNYPYYGVIENSTNQNYQNYNYLVYPPNPNYNSEQYYNTYNWNDNQNIIGNNFHGNKNIKQKTNQNLINENYLNYQKNYNQNIINDYENVQYYF